MGRIDRLAQAGGRKAITFKAITFKAITFRLLPLSEYCVLKNKRQYWE
jgi:hypothetical protein